MSGISMKNIFAGFIFLLLIPVCSNAQPVETPLTQTIRGVIIDKDNKHTIPGAHVLVVASQPVLGAVSDADGNFIIAEVPVGRQTLRCSFLGYEDVNISNLLVSSGKEVVLKIEMREKFVSMKEVEIKAQRQKGEVVNKMATVSARSFTVEETGRFAGSFNDPARMAMSFAGVAPNNTGSNELIIRGNSPQGLLWQLEGVDIPNPNHFSTEAGTGGPISILNNTTLANSDFFTGAFPAEYGNAFSGVFDLHMRNGNSNKHEYTLQVGAMGVEAAAEGPFKAGKNSSYLFNYRYSTLAMIEALGIKIVGDAVPKFQDLNFKLHFPTKKAGVFSVFGIGGMSNIHIEESTTEEVVYSKADSKDVMGAFGVSNMYPLSENTYLHSVVSLSGLGNTWDEHVNYNSDNFYLRDRDRFYHYDISVRTTLNHKFNARHFIKTGIYYKNLRYDLFSQYWDERFGGLTTELDDEGSSYSIRYFTSYRFRITEDLTFTGGVHVMYFGLNGDLSIEPRAGIKWQFHPLQSLSFGYGRHSRMESLSTYLAYTDNPDGIAVQMNKDLDFMKARHFVLGYDNHLTENLYLKAELYYQQLFDVPVDGSDTGVFSILNQFDWFTREALVNTGKGYNYGLELTLEKYFSDDYYFLLTGSLFESKYKAGDGQWRNTRYNNGYMLNALAGKEFRLGNPAGNRKLIISLKANYGGGYWYTPVDLEESRNRQHTVFDESQAFSIQTDDVLIMNLKIGVRRERAKSTHLIELDIQNVTNTQTLGGVFYNPQTDAVDKWTSVGIIPNLNYRIQF